MLKREKKKQTNFVFVYTKLLLKVTFACNIYLQYYVWSPDRLSNLIKKWQME